MPPNASSNATKPKGDEASAMEFEAPRVELCASARVLLIKFGASFLELMRAGQNSDGFVLQWCNFAHFRQNFPEHDFFLSPRRRSGERTEERGSPILRVASSPRPSPPSDGGEGVVAVPPRWTHSWSSLFHPALIRLKKYRLLPMANQEAAETGSLFKNSNQSRERQKYGKIQTSFSRCGKGRYARRSP